MTRTASNHRTTTTAVVANANVNQSSVLCNDVSIPVDKDQAFAIYLDLQTQKRMVEQHKRMIEQHQGMIEQHQDMVNVLEEQLIDLLQRSTAKPVIGQPIRMPATQQTLQVKWPHATTVFMNKSGRSSDYDRKVASSANEHHESSEESSEYTSDNLDDSDDDKKPKAKGVEGKAAMQDYSGYSEWDDESFDESSQDD
jgi:hypothetical protein